MDGNEEKKVNQTSEEIRRFMELGAGASSLKEMFDSHIAAGFTENQSLKLLAYVFVLMGLENPTEEGSTNG